MLQIACIGLGWVFWWLTEDVTEVMTLKLIFMVTVLIPIIVVSFAAFHGIWADNDYNVYENTDQSFDFFVKDAKLTFAGRLKRL